MRIALTIFGRLLFVAGIGWLVLLAGTHTVLPPGQLDRLRQGITQAAPPPAATAEPVPARTGGDAATVQPDQPSQTPWATGTAPAMGTPAPTTTADAERAPAARSNPVAETPAPAAAPAQHDSPAGAPPAAPVPPQSYLPITKARVPSIRLEADVVVAKLVELNGGTTWEVPAFKVGHGEYTAGAGQTGNAVLLGHVTSRDAGNVFKDLQRVRTGDLVQILSGTRAFDYLVTEVRTVPRTDVSVLQPTETASVSLITCTGQWLPALQDYTHRLVVRAELTQ